MDYKNILEISFMATDENLFSGKIIAKCANDAVATIEMEKVKIDELEFSRTEIPSPTNSFMFYCLQGYEDKINFFAKNIGKESMTFGELIDYLTAKNDALLEEVKRLRIDKLNIIKESEKQNRKYKKIINSLQKTIGRLIDVSR